MRWVLHALYVFLSRQGQARRVTAWQGLAFFPCVFLFLGKVLALDRTGWRRGIDREPDTSDTSLGRARQN